MASRSVTGAILAFAGLALVREQPSPSITVEKNVCTTMQLPAPLERTPYSKRPGTSDALFERLAARGFVVVVQDTRGRYMSDAVPRPHDEGEDGRGGTFGGSYSGTTQ